MNESWWKVRAEGDMSIKRYHLTSTLTCLWEDFLSFSIYFSPISLCLECRVNFPFVLRISLGIFWKIFFHFFSFLEILHFVKKNGSKYFKNQLRDVFLLLGKHFFLLKFFFFILNIWIYSNYNTIRLHVMNKYV